MDKSQIKWYYRPVMVMIAILAFGPFAIPMVWLSPCFKRWHKVAITILLAIATIWLVKTSVDIYRILVKELQELKEAMR